MGWLNGPARQRPPVATPHQSPPVPAPRQRSPNPLQSTLRSRSSRSPLRNAHQRLWTSPRRFFGGGYPPWPMESPDPPWPPESPDLPCPLELSICHWSRNGHRPGGHLYCLHAPLGLQSAHLPSPLDVIRHGTRLLGGAPVATPAPPCGRSSPKPASAGSSPAPPCGCSSPAPSSAGSSPMPASASSKMGQLILMGWLNGPARHRPPVAAPHQSPPVPAPRQRSPVAAPHQRPPVPAPRPDPPWPLELSIRHWSRNGHRPGGHLYCLHASLGLQSAHLPSPLDVIRHGTVMSDFVSLFLVFPCPYMVLPVSCH